MKTLYQILIAMSTYNFMDVPQRCIGFASYVDADQRTWHRVTDGLSTQFNLLHVWTLLGNHYSTI